MRTGILLSMALLCSVAAASRLAAQGLEVGMFYGISGYAGDLTQSQIEVLELNKAYGLYGRYNFSNVAAIRLGLMKGEVSGKDSNYATIEKRRLRNLSFRSPIYEASLLLELNFLNFGAGIRPLAQSYLFSGVSAFYFDPQAYYEGSWVRLQPLGTEGQGLPGSSRDKYDRLQAAIPIGIGFRFMTSKKSKMGFELGFRKTFTDYIDDIGATYPDIQALANNNPMAAALSYRSTELDGGIHGNPAGNERGSVGNDMYFFAGVNLSIVISK